MTSYAERVYWHTQAYGRAVRVPRRLLTGLYLGLAVVIPFFVPVFLAPVVYSLLPSHIRYD